MKKIFSLLVLVIILITTTLGAQEVEIDASKPTNFYSFIDNTLEYNNIYIILINYDRFDILFKYYELLLLFRSRCNWYR